MNNKSLRYISISYKTASMTQREVFHISEEEKKGLAENINSVFPDVNGLMMLITCNRTEIYFESQTTLASAFLDFFISLKVTDGIKKNKHLFSHSDKTEDTVKHLLEVSSGLASSVLGDVEIVHQIKKAHQFSIAMKLQGSLLERCMQTVFKSHKRISNETYFRDGTTSIAYKSLKVVSDTFNKEASKSKKMLFIGAGDIVNQLFKYNSKFKFNNIYISNRTQERAMVLASRHQCNVYDWSKVMANDFQDFDVVISAVSNRHHIIKRMPMGSHKVLLIDLALPSNIDKELAHNEHILFYDLDAISTELEENKERRNAAIGAVDQIIYEELSVFSSWLKGAAARATLVSHKTRIHQKLKSYFNDDSEVQHLEMIKSITNQIMKRLIKQEATAITSEMVNGIIKEELSLVKAHAVL